MTQQFVYPTRRELERHAECTPSPLRAGTPSPYNRGFENGRYPRAGGRVVYSNPYCNDYDAWCAYDAGFADARAAAKQERI